ncbi:MAG: hypothetical protein OES47_05725 [Acidobacteriota bacterium]|nr:hypothetical protein [Acidobacteriota bacterium]
MPSGHCFEHPEIEATHCCKECRKFLCPDCLERGHRLLLCPHCGEMAAPVVAEGATTAPQLVRQHNRAAAYTWGEALFYVFRGKGSAVFGSYLGALAVLALLGLVPIVGSAASCVALLFMIAVLVLVPGTLYEIVRTTADGGNELPDWPELIVNLGTRISEIVGFLLTLAIACLPLALLLKFGGCRLTMATHCWWLLVVGWLVAFVLWVPMFGAVARFRSNWLAVRLDLHLAAIGRLGSDLWIAAVLSTVLIIVGQVLAVALLFAPFVGTILSAAAGMYGWFTAAHLVGVVFRRHHRGLLEIYDE